MASCVRSIRNKNYQNLVIGFQVIVENVGDAFSWDTVYKNKRNLKQKLESYRFRSTTYFVSRYLSRL